ncbi:hypothetical protein Taro_038845 [Colocasia esculenta]|uniref:Uncharacterized protein n=1 Tax=Colocasia esculenta TaxID=4460 RepID=A0A843WE02_COLES|nr:hypothetical protein [Colocasia esculenta]
MEFRRPFGENTDDLVGEIARLVTLCASFDVPYWRDVPEDRKTKIYEKLLAMSERNKVNRSKQVISHITGRRSFKQVSWAERNEGGEPPAHELWRLTHQKKDGSWGSEQSRQVYETVKDKLEELASQPCDSPVASTPQEVLN